VAKGTELAERAGQAMSKTQESTKGLVEAVQIIANSSMSQARSSVSLVERAKEIVISTQQTDKHMKSQAASTKLLNTYSKKLVETVSVFKLPDEAADKDSQASMPYEPSARPSSFVDEQDIIDVAVNS
jgi:methyl-accepting chemotaxis protein